MNNYMDKQFRRGTALYTVFSNGEQILIDISCHNLNLQNYWGGEWISNW
jgi:hypothetical protein